MLSQDHLLKCWDMSHCLKTSCSSVGTLRTVPRSFRLSVGTIRAVPRLPFKCWDTPHCPKTSCSSVGTFRTIARPFRPSVGTLRAVPRLPAQVLGNFALSQDPPTQVLGHFALPHDPSSKCWETSCCPKSTCSKFGSLLPWDSRISCSSVLGHLDHYPRYPHLSFSIKKFPQNPILLTKNFTY